MSRPVIIVGGGGHAHVIIDALTRGGISVIGICDPALSKGSLGPLGVLVLGNDSALSGYPPSDVDLVNGVGSTSSTDSHRQVFEVFSRRGYRFVSVVHPSAIIARDVRVEEGGQLMAGVVVQAGTVIGRNTIVNTGSCIDHNCRLGDHVHVAPGVTLSGGVTVGSNTHIGVGASIIQSVIIGEHCLIGAGTVVLTNVDDGCRIVTPPSRTLIERAAK